MLKALVYYSDCSTNAFDLHVSRAHNGFTATLPKELIKKDAEYVDFFPDYCSAYEGDEGYYAYGNNLTYFKNHTDHNIDCGYGMMCFFGAKTKERCVVVIATGLWAQHHVIIEKNNGQYRIFMRFMIEGCSIDENMQVKVVFLDGDDMNYSGMARAYRNEMIQAYSLKTMTERANEHLRYAMEAPEIRIRMGWKPVPSPVPEQNHENEPQMHVACTFDDVIMVMEACKHEGVEKAEFCLVGWNIKGHDGRWPEAFPVEESLGGEEGLKRLIAKAKELGYKLVCHTNATDCYSIADTFDEELPMRKRDMNWAANASWGGGQMYDMCPICGERYTQSTLKQCADLGFAGIHYIDVISTVAPRRCFSPKHPCSQGMFVRKMLNAAELSKELIGGFQSEGGFDYMAPCMDMSLYIDFHMTDKANPFCDKNVPIWQMVYHDFILANPGTDTVNYPAKGWFNRLKFLEFGGHPVIYIYSKFHKKRNWMGEQDYTADNETSIAATAKGIKALQDDYNMVRSIRHAAMVKHEELTETLHVVTYENGVRMVVNYGDQDASFENVMIPFHDMVVIS